GCGIDEAIVILLERLLEQFPEALRHREIPSLPRGNFLVHQLFKELQTQVDQGPVLESLQEPVVENRDVRSLDARDFEDVYHALRLHARSEEHTSELQSRFDLVCRLLLEKKK